MLSEQAPSSPEHEAITGEYVEDADAGSSLDDLHIAMQDLEHIDEVISQAVDTSSELMDEEAAVQQVQAQQEGVSQPALEALQRNVNSLLKQVGMEKRADFVTGSYANKRHNKVALESAIESIRSAIKTIWDAIMAAIDKTVEMVKSIFKHFFDLSLKIKNQCEAIKKQAEALKGKTHRSVEKIGSASLSRYVRFENKPLEPGDVLVNFHKWTTHNYNFIESISGKEAIDEYSDYVRKAAVFVAKKLNDPSDVNELKRETDALGDLMIRRIVSNFEIHKNGIHTTKPYIGDTYYKFDEKDLRFSVEQISEFKEIPTENSHTPMNTDQTIEMCNMIIAHMLEYRKVEEHFNELNKLKKSISDLAKDAISGNAELDAVQRKLITQGTSFMIRIFIDAIRKVGIGAREYDLQMCKALTVWCSLSMSTL